MFTVRAIWEGILLHSVAYEDVADATVGYIEQCRVYWFCDTADGITVQLIDDTSDDVVAEHCFA